MSYEKNDFECAEENYNNAIKLLINTRRELRKVTEQYCVSNGINIKKDDNCHEFNAIVEPSGHKCRLLIDGEEIPYLRGFTIKTMVNEVSKINAEMLVIKPFEINGQGQIIIDARVINKNIAYQVYESLKAIFEKVTIPCPMGE